MTKEQQQLQAMYDIVKSEIEEATGEKLRELINTANDLLIQINLISSKEISEAFTKTAESFDRLNLNINNFTK